MFRLWLTLLFAAGWAGGVLARHEPTAQLDADGRGFTFEIPKIVTFKGGFSATLVRGTQTRELLSTMGLPEFQPGQTQILNSVEGELLSGPESFMEETPHGRATGQEVALRFHRMQLDLLIRFSQVRGIPGFQVQTAIRNSGPSPVRLLSLSPVVMEGRMPGFAYGWCVTPLNTSAKVAPPVVRLSEMFKPLTVFEYGGFYSGPDGNGFLFGPVGLPVAYVQATVEHKGDCKVSFTYTSEMSGVEVRPGETRWGQQVALFPESPRLALAHWATWVAKTHNARTDKGALSGWNSYSFHGSKISGKDVLADVETVLKNPDRLRPLVMEIDTGYEQDIDNTGINTKFLEGMPYYAQRIAETGARPGILVNFKGPPGFENTAKRIREMVKGGFTYLKINRTFFKFEEEAVPRKTSFERMREGFAQLREAAGEGTYLLFNNRTPDRATVGFVDANRTGVLADRLSVRTAMADVLRSYHLNGRLFAVDNDSYYMGTGIANVSEIVGGWPLVRTWMSMVGLSCGTAITSDPWSWESFRPYWRNVEVMTPPAREETVVLDLCTAQNWPRLVGHVKRAWGDQTVALLWNPGTAEQVLTLDFERAGMNPKHRYAVWSFWDNRYLGVTKGSWKTPALGPCASQHLCFTDLDASLGKPLLIGSGLHIYCGAAEIKKVAATRDMMEIELTDAGARGGSLFIYSRHQPIWKAAEGCTVAEIASAGEYVWRIQLADRQSGQTQRVSLAILLPVTQQIWFWVLCGFLVTSLLVALWRYLAYIRLHEQHALEQERARIARDLHDDIGAGLTEIAMQSSLVSRDLNSETSDAAQRRNERVRQSASELTRSIDEIVWALNPANDTLDKFVSYLSHATTQFLSATNLAVRFDIPAVLPSIMLSGKVRHYLFLVVREAINNVVKHAKADLIRIEIRVTDAALSFVIEDNGCGFHAKGIGTDGIHEGLASMKGRLTELGGQFSLTSQPGSGTRVEFGVPLRGPVGWVRRLLCCFRRSSNQGVPF